jgi:hypothetical protein
VYFENQLLLKSNTNKWALSGLFFLFVVLCPVMNVMYPLVPLITTPLKFMKQLELPFTQVMTRIIRTTMSSHKTLIFIGLSTLLYLYTSYNTIKTTIEYYQIVYEIHIKVKKMSEFVQSAYELLYQPESSYFNPDIQHDFDVLKELIISKDIVECSVMNPSSIESNGQVLALLDSLLHDPSYKNALQNIMNEIGMMDHLHGLSQLSNYHFPTYLKKTVPELHSEGMWHPSITDSITNSIDMQNNIVLTGPNMGGKSTFIKNILINILLSQTIGICNSNSFALTPFHLIHTHIKIPDLVGKESLFEAEVKRVSGYINDINALKSHQFGFGVFDEILTSTNVLEGTSVAKAICDEFSTKTNTLNIITTHFDHLVDETTKRFENYQVLIDRTNENEIVFLYKIEPGISDEKIAIEILKTKGFDNDIIRNALQYKQKLQAT